VHISRLLKTSNIILQNMDESLDMGISINLGFEHWVIFLALWIVTEMLDRFLMFLQSGQDLGEVSFLSPQ